MIVNSRNLIFTAGVLGIALLGFVWSATHGRISEEKAFAVDSTIAESHTIASIAAANLDEVLARVQLYARMAESILDGGVAPSAALNPLSLGDAAYLRFAVFDENGRLIHSSSRRQAEPEMAMLVNARARVQPQNRMLIGRPAPIADSSAWRVPLAVPIFSGTGRRGTFAAVIDLGYFLRVYNGVELGQGGSIEILDHAGFQFAELSGKTLSAGVDYRGSAFGRLAADASSEGTVQIARPGETAPRIGYFQALERLPLAIVVTRDQQAIFDKLASRHQRYYWNAATMSILLGCCLLGLAIFVRRQRALYETLLSSERQKRDLIGELEQEKTRALQLASHDYLTGIPNRMKFHELARAELARARRSRKFYALFFLDLDKFKPINDTLGHRVGDLLLKAVAVRLRRALREYDLVGRLGGDEFVVLVSELGSEQQVAFIADKLVAEISAPFPDIDGHVLETSPSIGIALYPRDGQDVETLLAHADAAMYGAKTAGRGTYRFYDKALNASTARQLELISRFRHAIAKNEFCLHYQARTELLGFQIVGMEALVRWQHPKHGLIYPGDFIALIEERDLIIPLGQWVIDAACRQLAEWRDNGVPMLPVAVNISAIQLCDETLLDTVLQALTRHDISPGLLEIEVTESALLEDAQLACSILNKLKAHGLKISLDDYGTGFSGLSRLKSLPVDVIKIDRSFIRDIRNDTNDMMIVASTITLAHNLGLKVVAEGVESREQLVHLKTAGCDEVQGFYLHRPQAAQDILSILQRGKFTPE